MRLNDWKKQLLELVARHPEYGVGADLDAMTEPERWQVYLFLRGKEANDAKS
jgi:hypothetical protein